MKRLITLVVILMPIFVYSQKLEAFRNIVSEGYNFWVYTPENYDTAAKMPLVIFLHGNSLCGNDLSRVRRYGAVDAIEKGIKFNAILLAPQNPGGAWQSNKIMNVLNWVQNKYPIDINRIYVVGMSLGGYGTTNFVGTYPEKIAAAMALCGGGNLKSYCGLSTVPFWLIHGTADNAVSVAESQKIVDAIAACGDSSKLLFTKLRGMNHSDLARVFYLDKTYEWLFSHSLTDSLRSVNRNFTINTEELRTVYQTVNKRNPNLKIINGTSKSSESQIATDLNANYYTIKKGDTLGRVARMYHTSVSKLCQLNKIGETSILQIGQKIRLK